MFITFEGGEGAGKSTAIRALAERFQAEGREVLVTREPGAGSVGQAIRNILLHGETLDARAELFLFLADRAQHIATLVRPALMRGALVLCDRHGDSTVVYQGVGRGLSPELARELNTFATQGLTPDLTLLLDLPPEIGLSRVTDKDRLDAEPIEFHQKVREGFLAEAARDPWRWVVIEASRSAESVIEACEAAIRSRLS